MQRETDARAGVPAVPGAVEQRTFLQHLTAICREDERILAGWVIGSLASGSGDAYSDVDVLLAVRDEDFAALVADWPAFLARLTPTVFAQQLGSSEKPTITAITPDWLRFDITLVSAANRRPQGYEATALFTHDDTPSPVTFAPPSARSSCERLLSLTQEFLRVLGLLSVAVGRGEFIAGLTAVMLLRGYLIELFLLENGSPRGGAKRLNRLLTAEQHQVLTNLPPLTATHEAVVQGHLACARLFLPRARRLVAERSLLYPDEFERATLAHVQRTLGLTLYGEGARRSL